METNKNIQAKGNKIKPFKFRSLLNPNQPNLKKSISNNPACPSGNAWGVRVVYLDGFRFRYAPRVINKLRCMMIVREVKK